MDRRKNASIMREGSRLVLTVLGGTSVGTPTLIGALAAAQQAGHLPRLEVRLWGRAVGRAHRIVGYATERIPAAGHGPEAPVRLLVTSDLAPAMTGTDVVLCQVRAGGLAARAEDESMAMEAGVPGDEGLGPGGLASFLRSRPLLESLTEAWQAHAPHAAFFQLTSPLGLALAYGARHAQGTIVGLCELPATTSRALREIAEPALGPLDHAHLGLNHCSWLYRFRDRSGQDRTAEVIAMAERAGLLAIDPATALAEAAVPLPYLRLFYHPGEVLAEQHAAGRTRGAALVDWAADLERAYRAETGPDVATIAVLLAGRRMNWYEDGVVPALAAWCGHAPREIVLNTVDRAEGVALEQPCDVRPGSITRKPQPPLPKGPASLCSRLMAYERRVLGLGSEPCAEELADALGLHPLIPDSATALRLGRQIASRLARAA